MNNILRVGIVGPCPPPYGGVTRLISNHLYYWKDMPITTWLIPDVVPLLPEVYPQTMLLNYNKSTKLSAGFAGAVYRIGARLAPMRLLSLVNLLSFDCALGKAIRDLELDIIYAHHTAASGMVAVTEAKRAGIPSVVVAYGETWLALPEHRRWRRAIEFTVTNADWVVSTSEHCRQGAINRGADKARSSVIYAGIDLERFCVGADARDFRAKHSIPDDAIVISVLGLALRRKLDTFFDALLPLLSNQALHVLIGGIGTDADYLNTRITQIKNKRVKALGFVPEADLPAFYAATDILVVAPQTIVECMGQSMKEAMACGRAIVGANIGGVPEAVENGINGLLFEPDNSADLVRVLSMLACNRDLIRSLGRRGQLIAVEKFNARVSAQQTFDLFKRLARKTKT